VKPPYLLTKFLASIIVLVLLDSYCGVSVQGSDSEVRFLTVEPILGRGVVARR
jgi:hypothetical protein